MALDIEDKGFEFRPFEDRDPVISVHDIIKEFQNGEEIRQVLKGVTLDIFPGELMVFLGESGCGKSTLLNMIAGILSPDKGEISIDGRAMSSASQKEKDKFRIEKIGFIFQDFKLINEMTVADNINILRLEGVDTSGMDELLERLGISDKKNKKVKHLSGGQKQRVAIVRALVKSP